MRAILLLVAILAVAFAAPVINDNFISRDTLTRYFPNNDTRNFTEHLYEGFSARMRRIDTTFNNTKVSIFQFDSNHTEYISVEGQHCIKRDFREPWIPFFDWVKDSRQEGTCTVNGQSGQKWVNRLRNDGDLTLCAAGNVPLSVEFADRRGDRRDVAVFTQFVPGNPPAANFQLPITCL